MTTRPPLIPEQVDREAAASLAVRLRCGAPAFNRDTQDTHPITQAFAASRLQARREALAEQGELLRLAGDLCDELEAEVRQRWGDDIRLAHKVERDLSTVVEARAIIAKFEPGES
jgi:hypothetical protein